MMHTRVVRSAAPKYAAVGIGLLLALSQPGVAAQQQAPEEFPRITLTAGRSTVLSTDFDIVRLAVTDPAIADATVVERREVLIEDRKSTRLNSSHLVISYAGFGLKKKKDEVCER